MKGALLLLAFVLAAVLVQTWLFPLFWPLPWKPDLFLVLVVYLAFFGDFFRGALIAFALGCVMDVFGGNALGLHALVYPALFFLLRILLSGVNTETLFSFYYMVAVATCLEVFLLVFLRFFFGGQKGLWGLATLGLFPQTGLNLLGAFLLVRLLRVLRRGSGWRADLPGPRIDELGF